jgi:hypothetical protein
MPILIVYGIHPEQKNKGQLEELISDLQKAVASVEELGLTEKEISVFLPTDLCATGLGEEVICFCEGLIDKPERTKETCSWLAKEILMTLVNHFPDIGLIEVFVKKFHGDDGFAFSSLKKT